jgi:hypothetical protein
VDTIGQILLGIAGLGELVCFILLLVQMFQRRETTMAIVCIVLVFCCGIGGLLCFIYGWIKHRDWRITNIMYVWTACVVLSIIGGALSPSSFTKLQAFFVW